MPSSQAPAYLGIGDMQFAAYAVDAALVPGQSVAGADLRVDASCGPDILQKNYEYGYVTLTALAGATLPGTWRSCQHLRSATQQGGFANGGYFLRVA